MLENKHRTQMPNGHNFHRMFIIPDMTFSHLGYLALLNHVSREIAHLGHLATVIFFKMGHFATVSIPNLALQNYDNREIALHGLSSSRAAYDALILPIPPGRPYSLYPPYSVGVHAVTLRAARSQSALLRFRRWSSSHLGHLTPVLSFRGIF